ncbi:VanW family protein [Cellulomonas hominis]
MGTPSDPATVDVPAGGSGAGDDVPGSPLDLFEEEHVRRRWPRVLLTVASVVVVLGGAYVGAAYLLADRVPRGTTVAGVEIGGLGSDAAAAALTEGLASVATQPVGVSAQDVTGSIDPATAGLTFDVDATVDSLTGLDLRPQRLWQHIVGVGAQDPVTEVDEQALETAVTDLGGSLTKPAVDGSIVFADGAAHAVAAEDGWDLDTKAAADTIVAGWLTQARPLQLPTVEVAPDVTQEETDAAVADVATPLVSAPISVEVGGQLAELPTAVLAAHATFVPQDSELVLQLDGPALVQEVLARTTNLLTVASDASFQFQNDAPVIVPGAPGTTLDPTALAAAVVQASTAPVRTAQVELVQSDPAQSTAALEALGVTQIVSEFDTPLTSEPRRTVNITNGAAKINGTLVRPGETFSLTDALGPIDAAHGFVEAGAIVSGEHTDAWGGGLSQISTTTYNAAYLAGMEDVEHTPHSEWFSRYPEGREATLFTGSIDLKWKNNTPYGVLLQAWVAGGRVHVRVWSTTYWTVESSTSARSNVVAPTTVYSQSPTCEAQSAGNPGFSVTVTRTLSLNGAVQTTESKSWRYKPQNEVVCGTPPAEGAPAG